MKKLIIVIVFLSVNAWAKKIDVTDSLTHLECRAWGNDNDPYYFETKPAPHNPGDPPKRPLLLWRYNSVFNTKPIAYFNITLVEYDTETELYLVRFHLDGMEDKEGTLSIQNGGKGGADFYNPKGWHIYEPLTRCSVIGNWKFN